MPFKKKTELAPPLDPQKVLDPSTMSEEELRAYVNKLEHALSATTAANQKPVYKPWLEGEKRWIVVPRTPTNDVLTINGRRMVGRQLVTLETWGQIQEMHQKAVQSELARMQTRGNLVPPHMLPEGDISSRQPLTIANL